MSDSDFIREWNDILDNSETEDVLHDLFFLAVRWRKTMHVEIPLEEDTCAFASFDASAETLEETA